MIKECNAEIALKSVLFELLYLNSSQVCFFHSFNTLKYENIFNFLHLLFSLKEYLKFCWPVKMLF